MPLALFGQSADFWVKPVFSKPRAQTYVRPVFSLGLWSFRTGRLFRSSDRPLVLSTKILSGGRCDKFRGALHLLLYCREAFYTAAKVYPVSADNHTDGRGPSRLR